MPRFPLRRPPGVSFLATSLKVVPLYAVSIKLPLTLLPGEENRSTDLAWKDFTSTKRPRPS